MGVRVPSGVQKMESMKTKLLKKINSRIRILEKDGRFILEIRDSRDSKWHKLIDVNKREHAHSQRYHYYKTFLLRDFMVKSRYEEKKYGKR